MKHSDRCESKRRRPSATVSSVLQAPRKPKSSLQPNPAWGHCICGYAESRGLHASKKQSFETLASEV